MDEKGEGARKSEGYTPEQRAEYDELIRNEKAKYEGGKVVPLRGATRDRIAARMIRSRPAREAEKDKQSKKTARVGEPSFGLKRAKAALEWIEPENEEIILKVGKALLSTGENAAPEVWAKWSGSATGGMGLLDCGDADQSVLQCRFDFLDGAAEGLALSGRFQREPA
jgi:hypothetical protein